MKQRLLAGLLAVVLVLGLAPAALAAAPAEEEAAQVLAALDIMVGDESGNLNLGATVTRAEFTKLAVAASTSRDAVGDTVSVKPYPDVPQSHWAAPISRRRWIWGWCRAICTATSTPAVPLRWPRA